VQVIYLTDRTDLLELIIYLVEEAVVMNLHSNLRDIKSGRMIQELRQRKRVIDRERRPV
jgi:hypothetical protein